jgi:hypothetical protein
MIKAIKTQKHPKALSELTKRLQKVIPIVPDCPPENPVSTVNLPLEADLDSTAPQHLRRFGLSKG